MSGDAAPVSRPLLLPAVLFAAALLMRLTDLFGALEYDEIWSLQNYSDLDFFRIFTELDTPNNQGINTLFIKFWAQLDAPAWTLRLHSLAAGLLTVAAAGIFARDFFGSRAAGAAALLFTAFAVPLAAYSQLARGYSLQLAGLMLYALGLLCAGRPRRTGISRYLPESLLILGGAVAMLTLSTSVMYLVVMTLCAWSLQHRVSRSTAIVISAGGLLTLLYLGVNFAALNSARRWGVPLRSCTAALGFLAGTLYGLVPFALLPPIAAALWLKTRAALPLLITCLAPLLAALVTNAGPERAYLPLALAAALLAAGGTAALWERFVQHRRVIALSALLLALAGAYQLRDRWKPTDWIALGRSAMRIPAEELVIYRATSGYPLAWNNYPAILRDQQQRVMQPVHPALWSVGTAAGILNGSGEDNAEREVDAGVPGEVRTVAGVPARRFVLVPLRSLPPSGAAVIAVARVLEPTLFRQISAEIRSGGPWLLLNPLLPAGTAAAGRSAIWALPAGRSAGNWENLLRFQEQIAFYVVQ